MLITRIDAKWFTRELRAATRLGKRATGRWAVLVTPLKREFSIVGIGTWSGFDLWFTGRRRVYRSGKYIKTVNLPYPLTLS